MKEEIKIKIFLYGSMILALTLGVSGQSISYYINENIVGLKPLYSLTVLVVTSILLFARRFNTKQNIRQKQFKLYFNINIVVGLVTSLWSLFVLIMWWG